MFNEFCEEVHQDNVAAGWWTNPNTGESILETRNVPEMLMLIVSEVAEAMEGFRKNLMDDKLPHRKMIEVELADTIIRIADLAGAKGMDLGGAIAEKRAYNAVREDHKIEARLKDGGKTF
jgi:NTP pyrophosphatase (non-canonical NTP hydrolase)